MAISDCSRQAIWIKTLIKELGIKIRSILVYGDNQGSIFIASNAVQESCTKHINICYHYIRKLVVAKEVELQFVPGEMNLTEMYVHQEFAEDQIHTVPKSVRPGIWCQTSLGNSPECLRG